MKKIIIFGIFFCSAFSAMAEMPTHSHDNIRQAASTYVETNFKGSKEFTVKTDLIDSRLLLAQCDVPLEVFSKAEFLKAGRNSIGIRCLKNKPWTVYIPATIEAFEKVVVLTKPIKRGSIITSEYLTMKKRELSKIRGEYLTSPDKAITQQVTRLLLAGTVLKASHLSKPVLVKRGQDVTIQTQSSLLNISTTGKALMNGTEGQRIRVKNNSSNRILQATVITADIVSVNQTP